MRTIASDFLVDKHKIVNVFFYTSAPWRLLGINKWRRYALPGKHTQ